MSFKTWSEAQGKAGQKQVDGTAKDAAVVAPPAEKPLGTTDKPSVQGPPPRKS